MQLTNVPCHAEIHSELNVLEHVWDWWNDDQQRQWLQVNPGTIVTHGTSMGLWLPALDINRNFSDVLAQAHKHISELEDQDDFDNAFHKLHCERNQTLLQFANAARAACLKHDACGYPLPDWTKGMIFLRQAKTTRHLEDRIMAKTEGSRNFSHLLDAIQILARRPMSQISSSFPSYYDEWDDSTNATEYYDIDDHDDVDNDEYYDDHNELEDHDNEWIDMSGIPEDATFEEPELA